MTSGRWLPVAVLGMLWLMGSAQAARVSLQNQSGSGPGVVTWDIVYDPEGESGIASLQQNIRIAGDVGGISDVSGTDSGLPPWPSVTGFTDKGDEILYGGVSFTGDLPTSGPVVLGTFSVTWNGSGTVDIINVFGQFGAGAPVVEFPNETPRVLATLLGTECGNDLVEPGEACDDGNTDDGDGCSAACQLETAPSLIRLKWGVVLLAGLLLGTSFLLLRRRQRAGTVGS
jgi:cysteine-rich repeat protein